MTDAVEARCEFHILQMLSSKSFDVEYTCNGRRGSARHDSVGRTLRMRNSFGAVGEINNFTPRQEYVRGESVRPLFDLFRAIFVGYSDWREDIAVEFIANTTFLDGTKSKKRFFVSFRKFWSVASAVQIWVADGDEPYAFLPDLF